MQYHPTLISTSVKNCTQRIIIIYCIQIVHSDEKNHGVWNSGARWDQTEVESSKEIELSTQIKLVRYGVARYTELTWLECIFIPV